MLAPIRCEAEPLCAIHDISDDVGRKEREIDHLLDFGDILDQGLITLAWRIRKD
mgnify:CR=1 FL=1